MPSLLEAFLIMLSLLRAISNDVMIVNAFKRTHDCNGNCYLNKQTFIFWYICIFMRLSLIEPRSIVDFH